MDRYMLLIAALSSLPPNIDSLSWMDQLPLSQSPNRTVISVAPLPLNYSTRVKTPLKTTTKVPDTPVGTSSKSTKSISAGGNKFLSPEKSTPDSHKVNRLSKTKIVAVVRPLSSQNSVTTVVNPNLIVSCEELFFHL